MMRTDQGTVPLYLDKEDAGQVPEPAGLDRHAVDGTIGHHLHVDNELSDVLLQVASSRSPDPEQPR